MFSLHCRQCRYYYCPDLAAHHAPLGAFEEQKEVLMGETDGEHDKHTFQYLHALHYLTNDCESGYGMWQCSRLGLLAW